MQLPFVKYEATGNDFILIDQRGEQTPIDYPTLASQWCHRRHGVGADGLLILRSPLAPVAAAAVEIINSDGSIAKMCGNGLRAICHFLTPPAQEGQSVMLETASGWQSGFCDEEGVAVSMGIPQGGGSHPLSFEGVSYSLEIVDTGNLHAVLFVEAIEEIPFHRLGAFLQTEKSPFQGGINLHLVTLEAEGTRGEQAKRNVLVRTYERGVGETFSCGSGAVAVASCMRTSHPSSIEVLDFSGKSVPGVNIQFFSGERVTVFLGSPFPDAAEDEEGVFWLKGEVKRVFSGLLEF